MGQCFALSAGSQQGHVLPQNTSMIMTFTHTLQPRIHAVIRIGLMPPLLAGMFSHVIKLTRSCT